MQHLGHTRTRLGRDHLLHTPDAFVRAPWPGFTDATCVVHVSPPQGAGFTLYAAELQAGGRFPAPPAGTSRLVYVQSGSLQLEAEGQAHALGPEGFAFLAPGTEHVLSAAVPSRALVFEKPWQISDTTPPALITGQADQLPPSPLDGDERILVRRLLPDHPGLDFAVNTMTYEPGAALAQVETHVMEHGLVMLDGEGIYRLSDDWYPVTAGDVIYMAPYCPQWFGALGRTPARYLIYKDWNRHPLSARGV